MIKFVKYNWIMLSLVLLLIMAETFHLLFVDIPFNDKVDLDAAVYYLTAQFGLITFIPSIYIFILTPAGNKSSRCIVAGIIIWNIKEVLEEVFYIMKWNYEIFNPLDVNASVYGQIVFILALIVLGYFGYKRWKY